MFKNIEEIKEFIIEEDIVNLDVRSISENDTKSVVFNAKLPILEELLNKNNISLDLSSSFLEVFLAHRTLVIFAENLTMDKEESNKVSFSIFNNVVDCFASPERDTFRDLLGEITSALNEIGENVLYFYADKENMHSIVLKDVSKYSLEKCKYAIQMVAKAYNVEIDKTRGIFK